MPNAHLVVKYLWESSHAGVAPDDMRAWEHYPDAVRFALGLYGEGLEAALEHTHEHGESLWHRASPLNHSRPPIAPGRSPAGLADGLLPMPRPAPAMNRPILARS